MEEQKSEKKHKRSKSEHKKRPREEDEAATPRHHKKSKKHQDNEPSSEDDHAVKQEGSVNGDSKKKSKKHKKSKDVTNGKDVKTEADAPSEVEELSKKSKKKHKKHLEAEPEVEHEASDAPQDAEQTPKKRKKDKSKKREEDQEPAEEAQSKRKSKKKRKEREEAAVATDDGAEPMDVDQPRTTAATSEPSSDSGFPFYTQTVSLYVPFFPIGFDKPITNVTSQHLEPLLNHYSPLLRGVLLAYRNVNLSERPVRPNLKNLPDDHTPALLESLDEYAVGFGWLTADVDLFIPSRGAWMEGTVNLQSEGHIGVVCWNKFNASIEAKRLPAGWRWVDLNENGDNSNANGRAKGKHTFLSADPDTPDADPENEGTDTLDDSPLELAELHTTGYWVDEAGARVSAKPLRFRIKNFDVGVAGDYGYISIEGTTLNDEEERAMGRQEREIERRRREKQNPGGLLRPMLRRVPEFSLTSFGKEEQEEDSIKKTVLYQGSRPGTPDD
ncbi:hypothetical protein CONLIGDRAFT_585863 [Coniochaeta ligniaria NRRL 30616]|uniref:DNA-directed RNA polymerase subunit n=1 Tax=Coniochaeta ligniaria NRRL 30616 TaxID=1408157 RepID=A0A1J7I7F8_9PEZI|nr:hypothetical protein CONLIGDRAFT_585863 [Coniochaeta ligniaria NRRL 30616]